MQSEEKRFNAIAAFDSAERARSAVETLEREGLDVTTVLHEPGTDGADERAEFRAEMQDEVGRAAAIPGVIATSEQARGLGWGIATFTAGGLVLGLVVGLIWGFAASSGMSPMIRLALSVLAFGVGGATAGFVVGGSVKPRLEGAKDAERPFDDARMTAEREVLVGVHGDLAETIERAADVLRRAGSERVDLVRGSGAPLPPQHDTPRPADTPDRWWRESGTG